MHRLILAIVLFPLVVLGQEAPLVQKADNYIYEGNQAFDASNNVEAEKNYRRATATGLKKILHSTTWEPPCSKTTM